jgi:hypothetical protein
MRELNRKDTITFIGISSQCFDLGVMHGVDIALAHEDAVVRTNKHRAERVVAVSDRFASGSVGSTQVSEYLVSGHHLNLLPPDQRLHLDEIAREGKQLQGRVPRIERPPAHRLVTPPLVAKRGSTAITSELGHLRRFRFVSYRSVRGATAEIQTDPLRKIGFQFTLNMSIIALIKRC